MIAPPLPINESNRLEALRQVFQGELDIFVSGEEWSEGDAPEPNDSLFTISPDIMGWGEQPFLELPDSDKAAIEEVLFQHLGLDGASFMQNPPYNEYPLGEDAVVRVYPTDKGDNKYLHGIFYKDGQRMWMVGNKDMSVDFPDF